MPCYCAFKKIVVPVVLIIAHKQLKTRWLTWHLIEVNSRWGVDYVKSQKDFKYIQYWKKKALKPT